MNQIEKLFYESLCKVVESGIVWNIKANGEDLEEERIIDYARIKAYDFEYGIDFKFCFEKMQDEEIVEIKHNGDEEYYKHYRPDFLVTTCFQSFVIEIDGYDSHSNKEQFIHDKKRDRTFLNACIPTIRFAGSEVFKDPLECAKEVIGIIANNCYQIAHSINQEIDIYEYTRGNK